MRPWASSEQFAVSGQRTSAPQHLKDRPQCDLIAREHGFAELALKDIDKFERTQIGAAHENGLRAGPIDTAHQLGDLLQGGRPHVGAGATEALAGGRQTRWPGKTAVQLRCTGVWRGETMRVMPDGAAPRPPAEDVATTGGGDLRPPAAGLRPSVSRKNRPCEPAGIGDKVAQFRRRRTSLFMERALPAW